MEGFIKRPPRLKHYNVSPTRSIDLSTIAAIVNGLAGKKSPMKIMNPGLNTEYTADNSRLVKELGDLRFTSYKAGIADLYEYYAANLGSLDLAEVRKDPYLKTCRTRSCK